MTSFLQLKAGHLATEAANIKLCGYVFSASTFTTLHQFHCHRIQYAVYSNQFRLGQDNTQDLESVFESRLKSAGILIALLDRWEKPVYLTRAWVCASTVIELLSVVGVNSAVSSST